MLMQNCILYFIEYVFVIPCGSTFDSTVAILTRNQNMARELLWLNQCPFFVLEKKSLVTVVLGSYSFSIPLLKNILRNGFNPNQEIEYYDDLSTTVTGKTLVMYFLE
eukprot:UN23015